MNSKLCKRIRAFAREFVADGRRLLVPKMGSHRRQVAKDLLGVEHSVVTCTMINLPGTQRSQYRALKKDVKRNG